MGRSGITGVSKTSERGLIPVACSMPGCPRGPRSLSYKQVMIAGSNPAPGTNYHGYVNYRGSVNPE